MNVTAGKRIKALREMIGLTQTEFAEMTGIKYDKIRTVEQDRVRVTSDEYEAIGKIMPEVIPWLTYEGDISLEALKESDQALCRMVAAQIEAGRIPDGYFLEEKIKE